MEKLFNVYSVVTAVVGGILAQLFGGFDVLLKVLLVMIVLDYITGIIKGIYNKRLSSEIGWKGLLKKIITLIIVVMANVLQIAIGDTIPLREVVIMFYIANEGISLLENAADVIPLPEQLKNTLLQLRRNERRNDEDL